MQPGNALGKGVTILVNFAMQRVLLPMKSNPQALLFALIARLTGLSLLFLVATASAAQLMPITQSWRYTTNNLDSVAWQATNYDESSWSGPSPALLYVESAALPAPKSTLLPDRGDGNPWVTYYFRSIFNVTDPGQIVSLTFSNLIDDGAIFYLNGVEIQRVGVDATNVTYSSFANRTVGDATTFDLFSVSGPLLTNLVAGDNVVAVEVHQVNAGSSDIVFGAAVLSATNLNLTRGPYLQNGSHTNVTVRWRTDASVMGVVRYGVDLANLNLVAAESAPTNEHQITLKNLAPDTRYYYSIGTSGQTLAGSNANHFFVTSPVPGVAKPTRLWVIGDAGTANSSQLAVRNAYETFTGAKHTDLWLMLGDNAYDTGTDGEYQNAVFNMYTNLLRKSVLWSTLGNHETAQATAFVDTYPYFNIFTLPKSGEAGGFASGTEHYYSFDYGNIHFICLDSMTADRSVPNVYGMAGWLTNDLANTTADWIIAFFHHPPYTKGSHNSDSYSDSTGALVQMRTNLIPLLEDGGVDLVLSGHSHSYERSFLLDHHYAYSTGFSVTNKLDPGNGRENGTGAYKKPDGGPIGHQGTIYAVVGSSGQISGGTLNHPAMYVSLNNLGSLVLDISGNRLDAKFLRENGTTNDYFTILKLNYPPVASNLAANVSGDFSANLALAGGDINRNPISYATVSPPSHGLISNLNPLTGAFTYTPAHGFSGADSFTFQTHDGQTNSSAGTVALTVIAPTDGDANGLPDYWQTLFGLSSPDADTDEDGASAWQEYRANTNPTNAASVLRFTSVSRNLSGHCTLTWPAIGGVRYRVQYRDGDAAGAFQDIQRPAAVEMSGAALGTAESASFTDDFTLTGGPPPAAARFYRIQVVE